MGQESDGSVIQHRPTTRRACRRERGASPKSVSPCPPGSIYSCPRRSPAHTSTRELACNPVPVSLSSPGLAWPRLASPRSCPPQHPSLCNHPDAVPLGPCSHDFPIWRTVVEFGARAARARARERIEKGGGPSRDEARGVRQCARLTGEEGLVGGDRREVSFSVSTVTTDWLHVPDWGTREVDDARQSCSLSRQARVRLPYNSITTRL